MTESNNSGRGLAVHAADCLAFAMELQDGKTVGRLVEARGKAKALVAALETRSREARISERSTAAASLAVVALYDEIVSHADWPWVDEWMQRPLAFELFKEPNAGESFYARIDELRHESARSVDDLGALEVFATVLALGFRGKYDDEDGANEIRRLLHSITDLVDKARPGGRELSPHAIAPPTMRAQLRKVPLWMVGLGLLVLVSLVAVFLEWRLSVRWSDVAAQLK